MYLCVSRWRFSCRTEATETETENKLLPPPDREKVKLCCTARVGSHDFSRAISWHRFFFSRLTTTRKVDSKSIQGMRSSHGCGCSCNLPEHNGGTKGTIFFPYEHRSNLLTPPPRARSRPDQNPLETLLPIYLERIYSILFPATENFRIDARMGSPQHTEPVITLAEWPVV